MLGDSMGVLDLGLDLQAWVSCVAVWHHWHQNDVLVQYFAICPFGTTIVACSVGVVLPCLPVVSVVVVIVGSVLIGVCTLVLVLSIVCILASVWNVVIRATGRHGFQ